MKGFQIFLMVLVMLPVACEKETHFPFDDSFDPEIEAENFVKGVDNPYFPLVPETIYTIEGQKEEGWEITHIEVLRETKTILGIECVVIKITTWVDDILTEESFEWFAQDKNGNVWNLGEDINNYNSDGTLKDKFGSWEAEVDNAKPGIVMLGDPQQGKAYRQEYLFEKAEEEARVVGMDMTIKIEFGTFENCLKIREWSRLEPEEDEFKYYAPGVGLILSETINQTERMELTGIE